MNDLLAQTLYHLIWMDRGKFSFLLKSGGDNLLDFVITHLIYERLGYIVDMKT